MKSVHFCGGRSQVLSVTNGNSVVEMWVRKTDFRKYIIKILLDNF